MIFVSTKDLLLLRTEMLVSTRSQKVPLLFKEIQVLREHKVAATGPAGATEVLGPPQQQIRRYSRSTR